VENKENLLIYFHQPDVDMITKALGEQIRIFSDDARQACAKHSLDYPDEFEAFVIRHLEKHGIL